MRNIVWNYKLLFGIAGVFVCILLVSKLRQGNLTPELNFGPSVQKVSHDNSQLRAFKEGQKVIYGATAVYGTWEERLDFRKCKYSNCIVYTNLTMYNIDQADMVLFGYEFIKKFPELSWQQRSKQIWVLKAHESPVAAGGIRALKPWVNGKFNATFTYRSDSLFYWPYFLATKKVTAMPFDTKDYAKDKTKGAFVYVSNCHSENYNRLQVISELSKYIDVDVFGSCSKTKKAPCAVLDYACEDNLHAQYKFYLSFENSLCREYITEKFWLRMNSTSHFVPVAIGGISLEEYTKTAPPDSFLHLYNFTSIKELGMHLKYLDTNDNAYNAYHQWRKLYDIKQAQDGSDVACKFCELANTKPYLPADEHLDTWYNQGVCKDLNTIMQNVV